MYVNKYQSFKSFLKYSLQGFMVTAVVLGSEFRGVRESSKVSFTFEKQRITSSSCGACPNKIWCAHLIAAILYRIKNASKVCHFLSLYSKTCLWSAVAQ